MLTKLLFSGLLAACFIFSSIAFATELKVVTTLTDLRAIAAEVGQQHIQVEAIAKGTQDPHFIEAKPSYMVKLSRADLLIAIGLDLEIGWLPHLVQGARNPRVNRGTPGYLEVGPLLAPLEVPSEKISRAQGDVHPFGNPHMTLDPLRAGEIAQHIAKRLGELAPQHANEFLQNAHTLQTRLQNKSIAWQERIEKSGIDKIVTYHKTLLYFFNRFKIANPAILEPKPGIPPTSGHIINVIGLIKSQNVPLILVENFFDPTVTKKIINAIPTLRAVTVAVSVDGTPEIKTIDDLYEQLVVNIEGKK